MSQTKFDKWKFFDKVEFEPHPGQVELSKLIEQHDYVVAVCGRRWGKSFSMAREAEAVAVQPNKRVWIVAPNYTLADKIFREIWNDVMVRLQLPTTRASYSEMVIQFPWGSEIRGKQCENPASLVGDGVDLIIFDEAAKVKGDRIWEAYLEPTLLDRQGKAIFITTPEGKNWIYDFFVGKGLNKAPEYDKWACLQSPTWDNPHMNKEWIDNKRKTSTPEVFAQEYGAEFTAFSGRIFKEFKYDTHVIDYEYDPQYPTYVSCDFGYAGKAVNIYFQLDSQNNIVIFDEWYESQRTIYEQAEQLATQDQKYKVSRVFSDPAGNQSTIFGKTAFEIMADYGIFPVSHKTKLSEGLELIHLWLHDPVSKGPKLFISNSCVNTIRSLDSYRHKEERSTGTLKEKPVDDEHKHIIDCIRYFFVNLFGYTKGHYGTVPVSY